MYLESSPDTSAAQAISAGMVSLYKEYLGRGPTKAHTTIRDDMVVTVLEGSLTKAEQTLQNGDQAESVRGLRRTLQEAMMPPMKRLVEEALQREVVCALSDHCPDPDYAVEVLLLVPPLTKLRE